MSDSKSKVVVILGPTATGKTRIAVSLARKIDGEIISADSRQVYKGLDIGSGKDLTEYGEIRHHLIDILDPQEKYSSARFQSDALLCLKDITGRGKTPIICGGTGYYIKSLLDDYKFGSFSTDCDYTRHLESLSRDDLYEKLMALGMRDDHHWRSASKRRMSRAIEKASYNGNASRPQAYFHSNYLSRAYYISVRRDLLRSKIFHRLELRLQEGLIPEVKNLISQGISNDFLESLGLEYRWSCRYLRGDIDLEEMQRKLFTEICRFAKRQETFIRYMRKEGHQLHKIIDFESFFLDVTNWLNT